MLGGSMKCPTCNLQISSEANFCPRCGAAVGVPAQNPSSDIDATAHNYKPIFKGTVVVVAGLLVLYLSGGLFLGVVDSLSNVASQAINQIQVTAPNLAVEREILQENVSIVKITNRLQTPIQIQNVVLNAGNCRPTYTARSREILATTIMFAARERMLDAAFNKKPNHTIPMTPMTLGMGTSIVSTCLDFINLLGSVGSPEILQVDIDTDRGPARFTW